MAKTISHGEARRVYDRIGSWLDTQSFYENVAIEDILRNGRFDSAESVFEFGCGTGRFGELLLDEYLSPTANFRAHDVSPTMVRLARSRLEAFGERARVDLSEGGQPNTEATGSCDRFVSNYVMDLLSESDIAAVLSEAWRMLCPGGLLCLSSLAPGRSRFSRRCMRAWLFVHEKSPRLVGGCRPIDLLPFLDREPWTLRYHQSHSAFGIPSEVVIAERLSAA